MAETDTDEKETDTEEHKELLEEARDRFEICQSAWSDDRKRYSDDTKFASGKQWPEDVEATRKGRPMLVVDKLAQYVRQVVNDARQNRPSVKVSPVDGAGDVEVATIFQGLIRHIEDRSNADMAYDTGLECAVRGGMGYLRVLTEYVGDETFNQDLLIKRVRNPLTVWLDPDHQEPDGSDSMYGFVTDDIPKKEYKARYGKKNPIDFDGSDVKGHDWVGDNVRVAEYWYIEEEERAVHLLEDGTISNDEELAAAKEAGITDIPGIKETRQIPVRTLWWCRLNGLQIIEGPTKQLGKYIPIVPVWGNEIDIDGKVEHTGLINGAKDAQRLYNYSRSAYAERVALSPKAPYIAAEGQVEEHQEDWNHANEKSLSVLRYTPIDIAGHPVPPPMRQPASDIPAGFAEDMRLSEHDIQASVGIYNASLGAPSNERTGRAITARKRQGDVSTFHYPDNLSRAIRQVGRILVDLIPKIYDTPRVARILGADGDAKQVMVSPEGPQPVTRIGSKVIYNLGVGKYDVTISAGPSYTTLRQESGEMMAQMVQADPSLMQVIGDLWVKNMDWPGAQEMADRLKLVLLPQIQEAEQTKGELPPEVAPMVQQMKQAIQEREQQLQQMLQAMEEMKRENEQLKGGLMVKQQEVEIKGQELQIKGQELQIKGQDSQISAYSAETQRIGVLLAAEAKDKDLNVKVEQAVSQRLDQLLSSELRTAG